MKRYGAVFIHTFGPGPLDWRYACELYQFEARNDKHAMKKARRRAKEKGKSFSVGGVQVDPYSEEGVAL